MADVNTADAKLIQYLTEAHGKEKELETALAAHIEMAIRPVYKKRLKDHLKETKQHAKLVERRMKKLGASTLPAKANELASRGLAAAKGPLHAIRGTGAAEKQLKNAKTEYSEEHEEIATYTAIEILAKEIGDTETAKLARDIRRQEERMASFLEKQIPVLTKEVVKEEIPSSERKSSGSSRRRRSAKPKASSSTPKASASRAKASTSRAAKATKTRAKASTTRAAKKTTSSAKSTKARAKASTTRATKKPSSRSRAKRSS
jgi:ferritin-like metal-binding protein YciE